MIQPWNNIDFSHLTSSWRSICEVLQTRFNNSISFSDVFLKAQCSAFHYQWQAHSLSSNVLSLITILCVIYAFVLRTELYSSELSGRVTLPFTPQPELLTPCVGLLICSSLGGEIGGRSLGEIDGKMGWNLLSGSERMESALMGIKGTLEWESLDNVFNFFQAADDGNLLSQIPSRNAQARLISCYSELIASLWTHLCSIPFRPAWHAVFQRHRIL